MKLTVQTPSSSQWVLGCADWFLGCFPPRYRELSKALVVEFVGVALLQLLGNAMGFGAIETAALYTALLYATKFISGGHLNPLITFTAAVTGHCQWARATAYITAQILGAFFGVFLGVFLLGDGNRHSWHPSEGVINHDRWHLFLWETLLSIFFIGASYSSVLVSPNHGDAGPIAAGLALYVAMKAGNTYTGYSLLNPALSLANPIYYHDVSYMWVYLLSYFVAVLVAAPWAITVFGLGRHFTGNHTTPEGHHLVGGDTSGFVDLA